MKIENSLKIAKLKIENYLLMSLSPQTKLKLRALALLVVFSVSLFDIAPAKAQWVVSNPITDAPILERLISDKVEKVKKEIESKYSWIVMSAITKAMSYMANKVAYDLAVNVASGNWGQMPFVHTQDYGNYLLGVTADSIGTALESFSKDAFGFSICKLPDLKLDLALQMGLHLNFNPPTPLCSFQQLKDTWSAENIRSQYWGEGGENLARRFNASLDIDDTDFGIAMKSKAVILNQVYKDEEAAKLDRQEGKGAKAKTSLISGAQVTPAAVMMDSLVQKANPSAQTDAKQAAASANVWGAFGAGATQVAWSALDTFISSFAGTALDNFLNKGMIPFGLGTIKCVPSYLRVGGLNIDTCVDTKYPQDDFYGDSRVSTYRQEAVSLFAEILLVTKTRQIDNYDLLSKFTTCPDNPGPENCVLDETFAEAVRRVNIGEPLTIAQAVEEGLLHKDWKLIGPLDDSTKRTHSENDCYDGAYCYKNIKMLRKARILPLGFELAALTPLKGETEPWTLQEVLDGFYVPSSPFYHLVNPNWVLKIPPTRCKSVVYGTQLVDKDTPIRQEECADLQSCVGYDKNGKCIAYGYCLKETSVWRFNADYCDSQYATCKTLTNEKGQSASYLTRTLNSEDCNSENVGCLFYSNFKNASGWTGPQKTTTNTQFGYFLNNKVEKCESQDTGCTAFVTNTVSTNYLYYQKAPDYLGCYDTDTNRQNGVQWPQTLADFNKVKPLSTTECAKYAPVCYAEEENCNRYTMQPLPIFSGFLSEVVVGKFVPATRNNTEVTNWNDQCDASCVGYNSYKEIESRYSNGQNLTYIIPKAEAMCEGYEGCSAFVNLNVTAGGLAQTEYYSNLRLCMLPDQNKQKNYYTYEGSENSSGYQLVGYTLLKDDITGAPKQYFRDPDEITRLGGACSSTKAATDEDCRAFKDDQGKTYYAYLSKTIVASSQCTPYRLTKSEFYSGTNCLGSYGAGVNDKVAYYDTASGYCIYNGLPQGVVTTAGDSKSCSQEMVSCRKYQGNTAYYGSTALPLETFDYAVIGQNTTQDVWGNSNASDLLTTSTISTESLTQGGKSYKVVVKPGSTSGVKRMNLMMKEGVTYNVSFIAKGVGGSWGVRFWNRMNTNQDMAGKLMDFTPTNNWQKYEFTFISQVRTDIPNPPTTTHFTLVPRASGDYVLYVDNVVIREVKDTVSLVKDKLTVPSACDEVQTDNLPGQALGCRAYTVANNSQPIYLHNFSYLCREEAAGCTKVYDTNNRTDNNASDSYLMYNLWLSKTTPGSNNAINLTVGGNTYSCIPTKEADGCYLSKVVVPTSAYNSVASRINTSTIIIPPKDTNPSYLVLNQDAYCTENAKGCTALGTSILKADNTRSYNDVFLTIDPDNDDFTTSICNDKTEGCSQWKAGAANYYFKDPAIYGNRLCEWKKDADGLFKWLRKDTGQSCGILPSFGSSGYDNQVGICPANQSDCTMFVDRYAQAESKRCLISGKKCVYDKECTSDPRDLCTDPSKEYYLINNNKISDAQAKCDGKVSLSTGCILLDKTDNPNKIWDTTATYNYSESLQGKLVSPTSTPNNDANIVLQTTLDRECSLWSYCETFLIDRDAYTGNISSRCYALGLCDQAKAGVTADGQCASKVATTTETNKVLTKQLYQQRSVAWNAEEFTGYSIPNMYQMYDLQVRTLKASVPGLFGVYQDVEMLVHPEWGEAYENVCKGNTDFILNSVSNTSCSSSPSTTGFCYGTECLYPARPYDEYDIENTKAVNLGYDPYKDNVSPRLSCRGYPEKDSPFDIWVLKNPYAQKLDREFRPEFSENINLCTVVDGQSWESQNSDCNYQKYNYSGKSVYFGGNTIIPTEYLGGVCQGGKYDGEPCNSVDCANDRESCNCGPDGNCLALKSKNALLGWEGYCLEKDSRFSYYRNGKSADNTCLSWWPVEVVKGTTDLWISDATAGWEPTAVDGRSVCAYNTAVKSELNTAEWTCHIQSGNANYSEPLPWGQSVNLGTEKTWWFVPDTQNFSSLGEVSSGEMCGEYSTSRCRDKKDDGVTPADSGDRNGKPIVFYPEYANPYGIAGNKFGCESLNHDTGLEGTLDRPLVITNLPENSFAQYVYVSDDGDEEDVEKVATWGSYIYKDQITKIEVLISDSVRDEIESAKFDNNRIIFYNRTFFAEDNLPNSGDNKTILNKENDEYFVYSTRDLAGLIIKTDYNPGDENNWHQAIYAGDNTDGPGFIVYARWNDDKLSGISVAPQDIRGDYTCPNGLLEDTCERGMSFIFIVHYTDGTCTVNDRIVVRQQSDDGSSLSFNTKPVTWRLREDKVNLYNGKKENITEGSAIIYARKQELFPFYFGLSNKTERDSNADYFANSFRISYDKNEDTYFGSTIVSDLNKEGGVALINWNTLDEKTKSSLRFDLRVNSKENITSQCANTSNNSPVCSMFRKMFVKGWIKDIDQPIDFANPAKANSAGIPINPPVIAAPILLSENECQQKKDKCTIDQAIECSQANFCDSFQLNAFALGSENKVTGDLSIFYNTPLVMRFYAWADPAQMPLRRILVSKGTTNEEPITLTSNSIGNRKPKCSEYGWCKLDNVLDAYKYQIPCSASYDCVFKDKNGSLITTATCEPNKTDADEPASFGNIVGKGCRQDYYEFNISGLAKDTSYVPKVQVLDNWGWCSGECKNGTYGTSGMPNGGCYGDEYFDDCSSGAEDSWVVYDGNLNVE